MSLLYIEFRPASFSSIGDPAIGKEPGRQLDWTRLEVDFFFDEACCISCLSNGFAATTEDNERQRPGGKRKAGEVGVGTCSRWSCRVF